MSAFPKKTLPWYRYLPLASVVALFWWITGLGLWIHFTSSAYNNCADFVDILQLKVGTGIVAQVQRVISSMISTCIVFALFAVCIHALGIYRGLAQADQDIQGEVDETACIWVSYSNIAIQIAWWVIVLWMCVLAVGFGAFAAVIAVAKAGVLNVVAAQAAWTAAGGTFPPAIPGYCPTQCMSVLPTGLFLWSELTTQAAQSSLSLCVCDPETLQAALAAATKSSDAIAGMLVGLLLMLAYGIVLLAYLTSMFVTTTSEQAISQRLEEQGWSLESRQRLTGGGVGSGGGGVGDRGDRGGGGGRTMRR